MYNGNIYQDSIGRFSRERRHCPSHWTEKALTFSSPKSCRFWQRLRTGKEWKQQVSHRTGNCQKIRKDASCYVIQILFRGILLRIETCRGKEVLTDPLLIIRQQRTICLFKKKLSPTTLNQILNRLCCSQFNITRVGGFYPYNHSAI